MILSIIWLLWATPFWNYYLALQADDTDTPISDSTFTKIFPNSWSAITPPSLYGVIIFFLLVSEFLLTATIQFICTEARRFSIRAPPSLNALP